MPRSWRRMPGPASVRRSGTSRVDNCAACPARLRQLSRRRQFSGANQTTWHDGPQDRSCEGFRMPADRDGGAGTGAGVRKPPGKDARVVKRAGAAGTMGISRSRTGWSIEASSGVRSRLGWRWGEAAAPSCIGLCDALVAEALSAAERVVANERRRGRPMTGASDARFDGRCRVARS
jgi:hypothetical protein